MNGSVRRRAQNGTSTLPFSISIGYALLIGFACAIVLLLLATAVVYAQADPNRFALTGALAVLYLSAAVSGVVAVRLTASPLFSGLLCGGIWLILILLLSLISGGNVSCEFGALASVLAHAAIPASSLVGSIIGQKRAKRASIRHKKHRR